MKENLKLFAVVVVAVIVAGFVGRWVGGLLAKKPAAAPAA